jgi:hypothetical protein
LGLSAHFGSRWVIWFRQRGMGVSEGIGPALISGLTALVVAATSGFVTWLAVRRERRKWLIDMKVAWTLDLLRARSAAYPDALRAMAPLSNHDPSMVTPEAAATVAENINTTTKSDAGRQRVSVRGRLDTEEVTGSNPASPTIVGSSRTTLRLAFAV